MSCRCRGSGGGGGAYKGRQGICSCGASCQPGEPAEHSYYERLYYEDCHYVPVFEPERFHHPYIVYPFIDGYQHYVHYSYGCNQQGYACYKHKQGAYGPYYLGRCLR